MDTPTSHVLLPLVTEFLNLDAFSGFSKAPGFIMTEFPCFLRVEISFVISLAHSLAGFLLMLLIVCVSPFSPLL